MCIQFCFVTLKIVIMTTEEILRDNTRYCSIKTFNGRTTHFVNIPISRAIMNALLEPDVQLHILRLNSLFRNGHYFDARVDERRFEFVIKTDSIDIRNDAIIQVSEFLTAICDSVNQLDLMDSIKDSLDYRINADFEQWQ